MKLWILLFQTALGVVTPGFLQGLEINWKSGAHGRVSSQKNILENYATHYDHGFSVQNPATIRNFKSVLARPMLVRDLEMQVFGIFLVLIGGIDFLKHTWR